MTVPGPAPLIPFVARPRARVVPVGARTPPEPGGLEWDDPEMVPASARNLIDGEVRVVRDGNGSGRVVGQRGAEDRGDGEHGDEEQGDEERCGDEWDTDWADLGPLAPYLAAGTATDIFVNGTAGLWVDSGDGAIRDELWRADERSLRELAVRLIALGGRHIDETTPCVDVRLQDGIRVHAVLPPIATTGTLLSIRIPRRRRFSLTDLDDAGMFAAGGLTRLRHAIANRENLLVTGAAGSGKTTLLSAILASASPRDRIVAIEDVAELRVQHPQFVSLESRQANLDGAGEIGMGRLVREALRMRPDRLVLGECRGAEVRELLSALNTGHDGGAGTLHANALEDVPARMEALGALAGLGAEAIARQTVSAIGLVLHLERVDGVRRLAQMGRFRLDARDRLSVTDLSVTDLSVTDSTVADSTLTEG